MPVPRLGALACVLPNRMVPWSRSKESHLADFESATLRLDNFGSLNIADHSTTAALPATARNHARVVINRPAPHWEIMFAAVPVTHRMTKGALIGTASPLTGAFRHDGRNRLFAGQPQRRSGAAFARAQPRFLARDIVARRRRDALVLGKLDLKYDHVALAERHLGAGEVELPHPHEALIVKPHHLVAVGKETFAPGFERLGIVQLQDFDVADQKAGALDGRQHFG